MDNIFSDAAILPSPSSVNDKLRTLQVVGNRLNRLDEPVFIAVSKPLLTEFGIHHRLESCEIFHLLQ